MVKATPTTGRLICSGALLALLLFSVDLVASTLPINTDTVSKSVIFLYDENAAPLGTGFLVQFPVKNDPKQSFLAMVTARHVVDPQWAGCGADKHNPTSILARVNTKNYSAGQGSAGTAFIQLDLIKDGHNIFLTHTDDKVDAVVIPLNAPVFVQYDVAAIALQEFATKEEIEQYRVGIGDSILSAGLVPIYANEKRNYAAFKFGKISNIFDAPVEKSRCGPQSTARATWSWLIAGNFVGGNSGSPIFLIPLEFTLGKGLEYHGPRVMLLGLLSSALEGADLAEMTPVEYIFEIIRTNYAAADLTRTPTLPPQQPSPTPHS